MTYSSLGITNITNGDTSADTVIYFDKYRLQLQQSKLKHYLLHRALKKINSNY